MPIDNKKYLPYDIADKIPSARLEEGGVCAPAEFAASAVYCGIKRAGYPENAVTPEAILTNDNIQNNHKPDVALIVSETDCAAAAVYTQNLVKGAPVTVCREHLRDGRARAVIVNSGNANTCNADGVQKAKMMCALTAAAFKIPVEDVLVASTGVIGQPFPIEPVAAAVPYLAGGLKKDGSPAARAIMTTDTVSKEAAVSFELSGKRVTVGAMCKGSGMIHPNMATMLCFATTDADISSDMLDKAIRHATHRSFNMLSVDGDTSTNDMFAVLANGRAGNPRIEAENDDFVTFQAALTEICQSLCLLMARDGEGATKLIVCNVSGADDEESARKCAKSVICSPLCKSAMFGRDANWGRILCAVGYAGADIDPDAINVSIQSAAGSVAVCGNGRGVPFSEEEALKILSEDRIDVTVSLGGSEHEAAAYGCDLTYDYVKINGDYRT